MPRNFGIIPQSTRIESAARIATCWDGKPPPPAPSGTEDDPLAAAKGICVGLAIMLPLWVALAWWLLW